MKRRDFLRSSLGSVVAVAALEEISPATVGSAKGASTLNVRSAKQWAGRDLRKADLTDADLAEADLRGAILDGANLSRADLRGAQLDGAQLEETILIGGRLTGASLAGSKLLRANFDAADLRDVDFRKAQIEECRFVLANLCSASFFDARVREVNFRQAKMDQVSFRQTRLEDELDFGSTRLPEADFHHASLSGFLLLHDSILDGADFRGLHISRGVKEDPLGWMDSRIVLDGSRLRQANLSGLVVPIDCKGTSFVDAMLMGTSFGGSADSDLSEGFDASGADFSGANLANAILDPGMVLRNHLPRFDGANLAGTRMRFFVERHQTKMSPTGPTMAEGEPVAINLPLAHFDKAVLSDTWINGFHVT